MPSRSAPAIRHEGIYSEFQRLPELATDLFVEDTFTDTDAVELGSHTGETAATWTKHPVYTSGVADIRSNRLHCKTSVAMYTPSPSSVDTPDYDVQAILRCVTLAGRMGIAARVDPTVDTMYYLRGNQPDSLWELKKSVSGTITTIKTVAQTFATSTDYNIRMVLRGNWIWVFLDGTLIMKERDNSITAAGKPGIIGQSGSSTGVQLHLDEFHAYKWGW